MRTSSASNAAIAPDAGVAGAPVFLWATPRSVSTAFERVMKNSAHLGIRHEPFTAAYYFGPERVSDRYGDIDPAALSAPADGAAVNRQLCEAARDARLFIKDLAFQAAPYIDDAFLRRCCNIFITRDPRSVYASLVKLKPDMSEDEFGFVPLLDVFARVRRFQDAVAVIDGTRFRNEPERVVRKVCAVIETPFSEDLLHWSDGRIRAWGADEEKSQSVYHATLEGSKTIEPAPQCESVAVRPEHAPMVERAMRIYDALQPHMI